MFIKKARARCVVLPIRWQRVSLQGSHACSDGMYKVLQIFI
jgi:hypothetical protein